MARPQQEGDNGRPQNDLK
ncbi:hypothetical protein Goklo_007679, partial [Gossypium klotzschianum]|nr:hypothetical protein [Gossypium klotzschianum]